MIKFNGLKKRGRCCSCGKKTTVYFGEVRRKSGPLILVLVCSPCWSANKGPCVKGQKVVRKHRWQPVHGKNGPRRLPKRILARVKELKCNKSNVWFYCLRCDMFLV